MSRNVSLLKKELEDNVTVKKGFHYKVYIQNIDGTVYSTKLTSEVQTVQDAIVEAVKKFNNNLGAGLTPNPDFYELYLAKSGRRDSGLPSLQKGQSLEKVGRGKFFLVCLQKENRLQSVHSLQSLKTIEMDFDKKGKKPQSNKQKGLFCFCGGW